MKSTKYKIILMLYDLSVLSFTRSDEIGDDLEGKDNEDESQEEKDCARAGLPFYLLIQFRA